MYLNENKTLKELRERGFYIGNFSFYYEIDSFSRLVFEANFLDKDYLKFIGTEYSGLVYVKEYEKEKNRVLKELKEEGFVVGSKQLNERKRIIRK